MQLFIKIVESHVVYPLALLYVCLMSFGLGLVIGLILV